MSVSGGRGLGFGLAGVVVVLLGVGAITGGVLLRSSPPRLVRVSTLWSGGAGGNARLWCLRLRLSDHREPSLEDSRAQVMKTCRFGCNWFDVCTGRGRLRGRKRP